MTEPITIIDCAIDVIQGYKGYDGLGNDFVEGEAAAIAHELEMCGLLRSDEPERDEVMSFRWWGNNSHMIEDLFTLGYLNDDMAILDPTFGLGVFWRRHLPPKLVACDLHVRGMAVTGPILEVDFTEMPFEGESFDAVVFDPDYKLQGTSSNAGPASSNPRYGMDREYRSVDDALGNIAQGLRECVRVCRKRGIVAVKCMDQVVSGHVTWQTILIANGMEMLGCDLVDSLHLEGYRKQPTHDKCKACDGTGQKPVRPDGMVQVDPTHLVPRNYCAERELLCNACDGTRKVPRRQVHARRNYSTLLVFQKVR